MRIAILAMAGVLILGTAAYAGNDFDISIDLGASNAEYSNNTTWYFGDQQVLNGVTYTSQGLTIGVHNDDWALRYRNGNQPVYYNYPYYQPYPGHPVVYQYGTTYQPVEPWEPQVKSWEPSVKPWGNSQSQVGTHPNDRGGYRVFTPRGLGGEPELYGDYVTGNQSPVQYYPRTYYRPSYPVVVNYSYGYPYNYRYPVYTAPNCPEYGYVSNNPRYYRELTPYDPASSGSTVYADEVNVYQGDVYYVNDQPMENVVPAQVAPVTAPAQTPPAADIEPVKQARGVRFYDQKRFETEDTVFDLSISNGRLYSGLNQGVPQLVSDGVNQQIGAFIADMPDDNTYIFYVKDNQFRAAYPLDDGGWQVETLNKVVDPSSKITLGLISGAPWIVFSSKDGNRYVYSFYDGVFQEIGSGANIK